jgi:hypothetical protein
MPFVFDSPEVTGSISDINKGSVFSYFKFLFKEFLTAKGNIFLFAIIFRYVLLEYFDSDIVDICSNLSTITTLIGITTISSGFGSTFLVVLLQNFNIFINKFLNLILNNLVPLLFFEKISCS